MQESFVRADWPVSFFEDEIPASRHAALTPISAARRMTC
jgi:hypothetical protein